MSKKPTLFYVGLEQLESRYTLQLTEWNLREFRSMGIPHHIVEGTDLSEDKTISVGQVLDGYGRPYYAMSQIQRLIVLIKTGQLKKTDVIFFEDMFHPGFESLPYIFNQLGWRPKIFVRCLAQTIDPDDFVHSAGMTSWMRKYESMVNSVVDAVLIASHEMAAFATAAGWTVPLIVTGLPFGKAEVRDRVGYRPSYKSKKAQEWGQRKLQVVFAARLDQEKQPMFFVDLALMFKSRYPKVPVDFAILSGKPISSNLKGTTNLLYQHRINGDISIYENLSKNDYYKHLTESRVLFNCALQDWVSNTVSEADALGCNVLYPAYRSFPEVFESDHTRLYVPWSLEDACTKLSRLLLKPHPLQGQISDYQDCTIERSVNAMLYGDRFANKQQVLRPLKLDPRDTKYRHEFAALDSVSHNLPEFWSLGKVTSKQLLDSYKG